MKTRELTGNLALALGVGAVFLGLLEGGARLVEKRRAPRPEVADYIWDWDDKMPGGFYVMKSDGVGWPPWEEFNADGLRDRTRSKERPGGYRRIAFLGDSVTLGAELTPQEAYPQLLESQFAAAGSRTEVMSVALWGWSTRQERTAWQKIARAYHLDQAVLAVCLNDIPELQNNLARPARWLVALHEHLALVRLLIDPEGREIDSVERLFSEPDSPRVREALARFFDEVRALRLEVVADGASFALVVFPFRFQVEPGAPRPVVQERIARFCEDEKLQCLDLLPAIGKLGPGAFRDYDHLSPSGHVLAADTLRTSGMLAEGDSDPRVLFEALGRASDVGSRAALRWLAGGHGSLAASGLEAFEARLDAADPSVRQAAAWGLAAAGPIAAPKTTLLALKLGHDEQPGVRMACARALGAIGSRLGVPALLEALADPSESVRAAAAQALFHVGPAPEDVPALTAALASPDRYIAAFAAWSLGNIGAPAAESAVPQLAQALARDDTNAVVAGALARIGPAAAAAVPELVRALKSEDDGRRFRAARTLGRIGPPAAAAVEPLADALRDPNSVVRLHAARALGRIGPAAKPVATALQRATGDRDAGVRDEARKALERLAGGAS